MRILGVIAEYNPFHHGHAWHLQQARKLSGADHVVVVMSSCFTQRGEPSLFSPRARAEMALSCGADAVFAIPSFFAARDAEHFALAGVKLLSDIGCDSISFGSEYADLDLLSRAACLLEEDDVQLQYDLQTNLSRGLPYPAALSAAAEARLPGSGALLSSPNSTLSICYLRAIHRLQARMEVFPVTRASDYHSTGIAPDVMPSATALRNAILRGDWTSAKAAMPEAALLIARAEAVNGRIHRPEALDTAIIAKLRTMTDDACRALPDAAEGIENRLRAAAAVAASRRQMLQTAKTRRYTHARLSRMAAHALLDFTQDLFDANPLPDAAWLLGFRRDARDLLTAINERSRLPLIAKAADHVSDSPWFTAELRAYALWALGVGEAADLALRQGVAVI